MPEELRGAFHRELDQLDIAIATLLGLMPGAIRSATAALLSGGDGLAESVERWRALVDGLYSDVEATIEAIIARQAPVARDLRFLLCCLRTLPAVRDAVDLVGRIGAPGLAGSAELSAASRAAVTEMGEVAAALWAATEQRWRRDGYAANEAPEGAMLEGTTVLREKQEALIAELGAGSVAFAAALQLAVRAAAYDRLARHSATVDGLVARLSAPLPQGPGGT